MPILRGAGARSDGTQDAPEVLKLSAQIPAPDGNAFCQIDLELHTAPGAGGEEVRLRAHLRTDFRTLAALSFAGAAGAAAGAGAASGEHAALPGSGRGIVRNAVRGALAPVGRFLRARLESPLAQGLLAPVLDKTVDTWIDLHASSAPLDRGADALVPQRFSDLGVALPEGQPLTLWEGQAPGPRPGLAQLLIMRLTREHLPPALQRLLGERPFQLAGAIANVIESDTPA